MRLRNVLLTPTNSVPFGMRFISKGVTREPVTDPSPANPIASPTSVPDNPKISAR